MSNDFYAGLIAGIVSNTVCNPFDVIRVNKQINNEKIIKYNLRFLTRGLMTGFITIPAFWSIYFELYSKLKVYNSNTFYSFLNGFIACNTTATLVCPLYVIRFKNQTENNFNPIQYYKKYGIKPFYNGLISTYFVNASFIIQMPVYELLKKNEIIKSYISNDNIRIFFITSIAKTVASCFVYPLDTIRAISRSDHNLKFLNIINKLNKNPIMYYYGISLYLLKSIPYHTSAFCTFEYFKKRFE